MAFLKTLGLSCIVPAAAVAVATISTSSSSSSSSPNSYQRCGLGWIANKDSRKPKVLKSSRLLQTAFCASMATPQAQAADLQTSIQNSQVTIKHPFNFTAININFGVMLGLIPRDWNCSPSILVEYIYIFIEMCRLNYIQITKSILGRQTREGVKNRFKQKWLLSYSLKFGFTFKAFL